MQTDIDYLFLPWTDRRECWLQLERPDATDRQRNERMITVTHNPPLIRLKRGEWLEYETEVVFKPTRESWKAAWRVARLLAGAHRARPALIECEDLSDVRIELGNAMAGCIAITAKPSVA